MFDNKEYKQCKKECIKILEKNSDNIEVLALKGITLAHLGEKDEGLKDIKDAIKKKFSNPIPWHFLALYYKEEKNYEQAMKNYTMALKHDSQNFNILREQSYLQLYLRYYESFLEATKKALNLRSSLVVNWVSYSFANYLVGNFAFAEKVLDSAIKISSENVKGNELNELKSFKLKLILKQNNYKEALTYLIENEKDFTDKTFYNEALFKVNFNLENYSAATENVDVLIKRNSENMQYTVDYLRSRFLLKNPDLKIENVTDFNSLLNHLEVNASFRQILNELYNQFKAQAIENGNKEIVKSKVVERLGLALTNDEDFKNAFTKYLKSNIQSCNPSIFINIKWIYELQESKLVIINEIIESLSKELDNQGTIFGEDLVPHIAWFRYFLAQHHIKLANNIEALDLINQAIDSTPSVIEFFMLKSNILKRSFLFDIASKCYNKARILDVGDRYLNAKHAKIALRADNLEESLDLMKLFVKDPLSDENIDHIQTSWYIIESAQHHLRKGQVPQADRLVRGIIQIFASIFEDQFDFYNYCLRRNVVNQLTDSIEYMDRLYDNHNLYKALEIIDYIYEFYSRNSSTELEQKFLELNKSTFSETNFKFKSFQSNKTDLGNELFKVLGKLQNYSRNEFLHFSCVKYGLIHNRVLFSLKSLNFLKRSPESIFYSLSFDIFSNYLINSKSSDKPINQIFLEIIQETIPELKDEASDFSKSNEANLHKYIDNFTQGAFVGKKLDKHLQSTLIVSLYLSKSNYKRIESIPNYLVQTGYDGLRYISFKSYSKLIYISRLFLDEEKTQNLVTGIKQQFKSLAEPAKSVYNLDLYDIFNENRKAKVA